MYTLIGLTFELLSYITRVQFKRLRGLETVSQSTVIHTTSELIQSGRLGVLALGSVIVYSYLVLRNNTSRGGGAGAP